jgi:hypothetical protein
LGADTFLFNVLPQRRLVPQECPVYHEHLLYFFYGRPAYRPYGNVLSTSQASFRPICLIFHSKAISEIIRTMPLDSGAFHGGLFSRYLSPKMTRENFEIHGGCDGAARFVSAFFGTNRNYYLGRIRANLSLRSTDLVAQTYCSIVSDSGITEVDDRRSTIELQISIPVNISSSNLAAIAIPEAFLEDDDELARIINEEWQADIIEYDIYADRPKADVREVMSRVKDYLTRKGYLDGR